MSLRRVIGMLAIPISLVLAASMLWAAWSLQRPYAGWSGDAVDVALEPGLTAGTMLERLAAAGVLERPALLRSWLRVRGGSQGLHAGEYRFSEPMSPLGVLARLEAGDVLLYPVTVPEGLVMEQIAERLALAGFGPSETLLAAFRNPEPILDLNPDAEDLEGYLFPDTYHFPRSATGPSIAQAMVDRFREVSSAEVAQQAADRGLDLNQVVHPGLADRERDLGRHRAGSHLPRLSQPLGKADATAVRSDGALRIASCGPFRRSLDLLRLAVRLAMEHLPGGWVASSADREPRSQEPRRRRQSIGRGRAVFRGRARRGPPFL